MKHLSLRLVVACSAILFFVSCEGNGPRGRYIPVERSDDEILEDVGRAVANDSYVFDGAVELHYYDGGWISDGMYKLYHYPNGSRYYVLFGSGDLMPVYDADRAGYYHRVSYGGVDYYY